MKNKRLEQQKETWIRNVMKVQGLNRMEAEVLYAKIRPFMEATVKKLPIL